MPHRLLHALQRIARNGEQLAPTAPPHCRHRRLGAIALGTGGDEERHASPLPSRDLDLAMQRESRSLAALRLDARVAVGRDGERGESRLGGALEHHHLIVTRDHAVRVGGGARAAHAQLAVAEHALERDRNPRRGVVPILDRDRVDGAGEVRVATVRREERTSDDEPIHGAREGWNPAERALPGELERGECARAPVHRDEWAQQRRPVASQKVGRARELQCGARPPVQHAERMEGAVCGVNARQREPVIPGHLPGHCRNRYLFHERLVGELREVRESGRTQTSTCRSLLAMRATAHRSVSRTSVDNRARVVTVSSGPRACATAVVRAPSPLRVPFRIPRPRARPVSLAFALLLGATFPCALRAQSVLGYGEDATAAPSGALRFRLSNDWHRSRAFGSAKDTSYDTDQQFRATTFRLELGVLSRLTLGVEVPWVTTKALTFVSSMHTVSDTLPQRLVLDTLIDASHNGWGNIEAFAKVVWLGEPGQTARLAPREGVHVRSAITAGALLGTGIFVDASDPFALATSTRERTLILHSATDVTVGRHFFASIVGRYAKPKADEVTVAVRPADDPFTRGVRPFSAQRQLGTRYELEFTPRYQLGRYFAIGAQYRYHHGAQDSYTGTFETTGNDGPVTLDASTLDVGTEITEHRAGFGVVYSAVDAYARRHSRFPFEVTFEHTKVVSISGGRPKDSETMISIRLFHRFWGGEFANPPAERVAPAPAAPPAPPTP